MSSVPLGQRKSKVIFIVSAIEEEYGGSETIWYQTVPLLLEAGYRIMVLKEQINRDHPRFQALAEKGVLFSELVNMRAGARKELLDFNNNPWLNKVANFQVLMEVYKPALIIVNQGVNFDGLFYGLLAHRQNMPYVVLAHKAVDFYWPWHNERDRWKQVWLHSTRNWFVSEHNLRLTQEQFGMEIPRTGRLHYPIRTFPEPLAYPSTDGGFRLACVGRLFLIDKGQDILLRILARPEWKDRPVHVDFIGSGSDESGLRDMAAYLGVTSVGFKGYVEQDRLWEQYHALVLPSRSEGLPLVVQEAMASGRTVIAGNAGGTGEIVQDGVNGFLGEPFLKDFAETMERAWARRADWQAMGLQAFQDFQAFYPGDPVRDFFHQVTSLARA